MENQQMQNMMNLVNNFMQMQQPVIFDPKKIDDRTKKQLSNNTIYQVKNGLYKKFPAFKMVPFSYIGHYDPGIPNNICEVDIVYEHILDAVEKYAEKGINYSMIGLNPVIVNIVSKEFNGSNLELCQNMRDPLINIRTTFCNAVGTQPPFPTKDDECVYSKLITIIKTKNPTTFLSPQDTYRTGLITVAPLQIKNEKLLSGNKMCSEDFMKTLIIIECVFQAAISRNHSVIVLPPFGHEDDNNPIDDIIKIYNYCIYKYGHMFKKIIIAVPQFYPKSIFDVYSKKIIKPTEIVNIVDKKYEKDDMTNNLMKTSADKQIKETKQDQLSAQNNINPEQMEMFIKMYQMMQNKNMEIV